MDIKPLIKRLLKKSGYEIINLNDKKKFSYQNDEKLIWDTYGMYKVQYGCRGKFIRDWINLDCFERRHMEKTYHLHEQYVYYQIHLLFRHPFSNDTFEFGYAEDLIEHFSQAESIIFLGECHRTLKKNGVLRLSFPGLEGVLRSFHKKYDYSSSIDFKKRAYADHGHVHFYSKNELKLVAKHLHFSEVRFVNFGESEFEELRNLDTRENQKSVNTYVELIK